MRSLEAKRTALVIRQGVTRRAEARHRVAGFAGAQVFTLRELSQVYVAVTGGAPFEAGDRQRGTGQVTLLATQSDVLALQGVPGTGVIELAAGHRTPSVRVMTTDAGRSQTSFVLVLVTVGASAIPDPSQESVRLAGGRLRVDDCDVTAATLDLPVTSRQRVGAFRMVEGSRQPALDRVAGAAAFGRELAPVLVRVAVRAPLERDTAKTQLARLDLLGIGTGGQVTLRTGDVEMAAEQGVLRRRMIEAIRRFPSIHRVARSALGLIVLSGVLVGVARQAALVEAEEGSTQVLALRDQRSALADVLRTVALVTIELEVRSFERVARQRVVQTGPSCFAPPDQFEFPAVVLDVALAAIGVVRARVKALSLRDLSSQRLMALEASIGRYTALGVVALHAIETSLELCVRSTELAR